MGIVESDTEKLRRCIGPSLLETCLLYTSMLLTDIEVKAKIKGKYVPAPSLPESFTEDEVCVITVSYTHLCGFWFNDKKGIQR